ncbi:MAG: HU family DNA-binding protein [Clostridia bacterium]|nr:HU family DNA-binding protein [Clostridia bacterium]
MNKTEFIKAMAVKAGFTVKDAAIAFEAMLETMTELLKAGEKIQIIGVGGISLKDVPAKNGINPQTKEKVAIPACKKPVVKFSGSYKDLFN